MNDSKEEVSTQNLDLTINTVCKWIQNELTNSKLDQYPVDMIKALAELVSARALIEREFHYFSDLSNE